MKYSDENIFIKALNKGDSGAFTHLIDIYNHKLCIYANSLINNSIQAEDVVQNVFIKVWERRKQLSSDYSLQSFLYKSVYNEFIDQYRKTQTTTRIEKVYMDYLHELVDDVNQEDTDKLIFVVKEAINKLPPKCKEVFQLSKTNGLTNIEISEYMNISIKTVEAQMTKGYKIIRFSIKEKIKTILFFLLGNFKSKRSNIFTFK